MPDLIRKIEPGDIIGRCRILRELGRGGVGTVYLATHQTLQIEVALKVLSPSLSIDNPALAERFIREAQLAARIRHPNVIAVMDAAHDESTGINYIVMEYVGGGSLSWHLRHGPLPDAKCLAIITGIAHALALAEENRIVHRDIKPDNILLDLRGTAKLADLGLAKHAIDSRTTLTMGGSFMGTPAYMSPEQARDAKVADTRDDIYSLGATFYECLTGLPPFQGETPYNIMSELLTKPSPQPRIARPAVSRAPDLICRKMMAKTRHLRYADARSLLEDLQIAQTYGDTALDRLEASSFESDSIQAHREAEVYGVQTSAEGVYVPEPMENAVPTAVPARVGDRGVYRAAFLLVALVTVATILLAWTATHHPMAFLSMNGSLNSAAVPPPAATPLDQPAPLTSPDHSPPTAPPKPAPHVTDNVVPPSDVPPIPVPAPSPQPTLVAPVALPVDPAVPIATTTNAVPALPVDPAIPPPVPAAESAFAARAVAEASLDTSLIGQSGHAALLRIIGRHEDNEATPSTWIFYFFDTAAAGNAHIVSVHAGTVVKNREDVANIVSPYSEQNVIVDETLIDSPQVLAIAGTLVPGLPITGSELTLLQQKNSAPLWKVVLWSRRGDEEYKAAEVTLLAENGSILSKNLRP